MGDKISECEKRRKKFTIIAISCIVIIALVFYSLVSITNPTIREWQNQTDKLIILYEKKGFYYGDNSPKVEITDKNEINAWLDLICTMPRFGIPTYCKCTGNPCLRLYSNDKLIAEITIHMGTAISDQLAMGNIRIRPEKYRPLMEKCAAIGIESYDSILQSRITKTKNGISDKSVIE